MNIKYDIHPNSTVLITGATGFIGGLLVDKLITMNSLYNTNINLVLLVRNIQKAKEKYPSNESRDNFITFIETTLEDMHLDKFDMPVDYIFHCACVTTSSTMISKPIEVADGIIIATKNILELARVKKVKSMVYLSSMEVYGRVEDNEALVNEDNLGYIDIYSRRSCYPLSKRMAEHYCYIYYMQYDVPVKIARLAQTFGYGVNLDDNRVFAQFARAAYQGKDIVLHTKGLSMGNYCESRDAINALFLILNNGLNGQAYNIVNEENTMTIHEMANLVVEKIANNKINLIFDIDKDISHRYAADTNIKLSSTKLRKLGWLPKKNLEEMYKDMIIQFKNQHTR